MLGATFEMRTTLCKIRLLNDQDGNARIKCATKSCGERARQQRDRERERERGRVSLKMGDGVGNEFDY